MAKRVPPSKKLEQALPQAVVTSADRSGRRHGAQLLVQKALEDEVERVLGRGLVHAVG